MVQNEPFTGESFSQFLKESFSRYSKDQVYGDENVLLVLDNAKQHQSTIVGDLLVEMGIKALTLPPYCPELNPAEKIIRAIKMRLKALKSHDQ